MTVDRPPRYYLRPRLGLLLAHLVCMVRGHRWILVGPADHWETYPFDCVRCEQRCRW